MAVEASVAEKLKKMWGLQQVDSQLDEIQILKGELPMEVADLEDEIAGLDTRIKKLKANLKESEQEIARMVAKGYPNKTIAAVLEISTWTVGTHLRRMFAKLGVNSRAALVAQFIHLRNED